MPFIAQPYELPIQEHTNHETSTSSILSSSASSSSSLTTIPLQNYVYRDDWVGTALPLLSPEQAADMGVLGESYNGSTYKMGRWPDPILRRPSSTMIDIPKFGLDRIQSIALKLRRTARENQAVGLAAQQW